MIIIKTLAPRSLNKLGFLFFPHVLSVTLQILHVFSKLRFKCYLSILLRKRPLSMPIQMQKSENMNRLDCEKHSFHNKDQSNTSTVTDVKLFCSALEEIEEANQCL